MTSDAVRATVEAAATGLTRLQRVVGVGLTPAGRLSRALHLHSRAVEAERAGAWTRADFFWRESLALLARIWPDNVVWKGALASAFAGDGASVDWDLRTVIARELFADTFWDFHQAHLAGGPEPSRRSLVHLHQLHELVAATGPLDDQRTGALVGALRAAADRCLGGKQWEDAEAAAIVLVDSFGAADEDQNRLAFAISFPIFAGLSDRDDEQASLRDAQRLGTLIVRLERLLERFPRNSALFDLLGEAYLRDAVKLANGAQLSAALVSIEKALTYDPARDDAVQARQKLRELMRRLQAEAAELRKRVATTPNVRLNGKGAAMVSDAHRGFEPAHAFVNSDASRRIAEQYLVAQGWAAWRAIGLTPGEPTDADLVTLHEVLAATLRRAGGDSGALEAAWHEAVEASARASEFDRQRIIDWLRALVDGVTRPATVPVTEWPTANHDLSVAPSRRSIEPPLYWLFSREARLMKITAAVAVIALCVAGGAFARDSRNRHERDLAFTALSDARITGDSGRVLDEADRFLAHSILGADPRHAAVEAAYGEALVRWFLDHDAASAPDRLARYRALVLERAAGATRQ